MYFFIYSTSKEFVTVLSIMLFIGTPVVQLIPSMILSLGSCLAIIWKRPYLRKLSNVLNFTIEFAYFLIYAAFLALHLTTSVRENERRKTNIGYFMIALIVLIIARCLVDLVVGLWESYKYIRRYCNKKNKVA